MSDLEPSRDDPRAPGPSLWPVGLALGIAVLLIGFATVWWIIALGVVLVFAFALLWARDATSKAGLDQPAEVEPEHRVPAAPAEPVAHEASYTREKFLEASTLGLGGLIGALITLPVLGFTVLPPFLDQGTGDHDLGPLDLYPEGQWTIATFQRNPEAGDVSRVTVFIRYNGLLDEEPSFTVLSNHCVHLGCPVQPNGPSGEPKHYKDVRLIETDPSGFGCPCHGGQYDNEGNR